MLHKIKKLLSAYPAEGVIIISYPSAGIIRIRFAGRELKALLSAWHDQAPRAFHSIYYLEYKLLFDYVKLELE